MRISKKWFTLLALPSLAGFILLYLLPLFLGLYLSFTDITNNRRWVGFENYQNVLNNKVFQLAVLNTFLFTLCALMVMVITSFGISNLLLIDHKRLPKPSFFMLPLTIPAAVTSFLWYLVFHYEGYLNGILMGIGLQYNWLIGPQLYLPLLLLYLWKYSGYSIMIYYAGIMNIPSEYYDVFQLESNSKLKRLLLITWPSVYPQTFFVLVISLISAFGIFKEIYLVWKDYPPKQLYMLQNFIHNNYQRMAFGNAQTASFLLLLLVFGFVGALYLSEKKIV